MPSPAHLVEAKKRKAELRAANPELREQELAAKRARRAAREKLIGKSSKRIDIPGGGDHRQFRKLKSLPDKVYTDMHAKLCAGISPESITSWLHAEDYLTDTTPPTLVRLLYRFRHTIPREARTPTKISKMHEKVAHLSHKITVMEELAKLIEYQIGRLGKYAELEERANMPLPAMGSEMDRLGRYLNQMAALKGEYGLIKPGQGESDPTQSANDTGGLEGGLLATLTKQHGDDAVERLAKIGKQIQLNLQQAQSKSLHGTLVQTTVTAITAGTPTPPDEPLTNPRTGMDMGKEVFPST